MRRIRRADLKPKREPSDEVLLRTAKAAATRAANRAAKERRAEEALKPAAAPKRPKRQAAGD